MTIDVSAVAGVKGLGSPQELAGTGADNTIQRGLATGVDLPAAQGNLDQPNILMDGMRNIKIPDGLLSGGEITAGDVARLNVEILNWTTGVTAIGTLRKELNTAKSQLLSEGKS
jgi:hypothetical protein